MGAAAALGLLAQFPAAPAFGQDQTVIVTEEPVAISIEDAPPPFSLEDRIAALPPVDAERLAIAERVVAKLMPPGAMQAMMHQIFGETMGAMIESFDAMPIAAFAKAFGLDEASVEALDEGTIGDVLDIYDPYWRERQQRQMATMQSTMTAVADRMEPLMRALMARAYARTFTLAELEGIAAFFDTPIGGSYAAKSTMIGVDPDFMRDMMAIMPGMIAEMYPLFAQLEEDAVEGLPEPRSYNDLTPAQRKRLAELLGVDEDDLWAPVEE